MSEGDVSLIHDEDLLRRMWQQTEDFGRKKEIRAHMYRLREERLRMLYSPEPARKDMGGSLVATLADDGFERAKRSEVRGGPSPPRDRPSAPTAPTDPATGEPQVPASTAGWEVQRSSATEDGGRTQVSSVRADLRGAYEAEGGGRGHFAAADRRSLAVTEGDSFRRSEASATTAAQDHLVQRSADGATITATSSAAHSAVRTVTSSSSRVSRQDDAAARGERERQGELVSRRVERPDERTTVLVETRQLPDGTTVTSTRREFRDAAAAREARTERHTRAEETETRTATSHRTHAEDSTRDVVRSQALADEADFEANHTKHTTRNDHSSRTQKTTEAIDSRQSGKTVREATVDRRDVVDSRKTDFGSNITEDYSNTERHTGQWHAATDAHDHHDRRGYVDETDRATSRRATDASDTTDRVTEVVEKTNEQYQTTYQTDYTQKRVSSECSPTHQAWASTLRGDSPRRSASPEKARRGGTPLRRDRASPGPGQARAPSASPDRKPQQPRSPASPGKGRPAAVSPTRPRASPESADRTTHISPERKPYSSADKITRDHYKFVEEETKTHTRSDQRDVLHNGGAAAAGAPSATADRSTSPSILRKASRSPSPPKGPVSFSQHDTDKYQSTTKHVSSKNTTNTTSLAKPTIEASPTTHVHNEYERQTKNTILTTKDSSSDKYDSLTRREKTVRNDVSPVKSPDAPRDTSPSKYGTYDRKRPTEGAGMVTTKESADVKYNSTRRDKDIRSDVSPMKSPGSLRDSSPSKHGIPGNKQRRTEQVEQSKTVIINESTDTQDDSSTPRPKSGQPQSQARQLSPTKKPRSSISPMKSPGKDNTHKQTSDFITTERTFEEINKKTRRLVTPSSSPTRKPHAVETEPSTGQSSPTTSVSGFIYYGAPDTRRQTIVTDLDDEEYFASQHTAHGTTTHERPQSLNLKRSPSPTKIPCRSPSPPQKAPPAKETLPRKSSLKKPPTLTNLPSPVEKPPSTFRVSPTGESEPEHKVVKKDRADKPTESDEKPKPPLERRETYTERCLKILGVLDDNRAPIAKKEHKPKSLRSPISAPPAVSPQSRQQSPRKGSPPKQTQHVNVTDFTIKQQEITSTKKISGKTKSPVRDNSPTKLQDIISIKTDTNKTTDVIQSSFKNIRHSVEKEANGYDHPKDDSTKPSLVPTRSSLSPEKKSPGSPGYRRDSPSRPNRQSPDRKPNYQKPESKNSQDETRQPRSSASPERKPGYMKNTVSSDTKVETKSKDFTSTTFLETTDRETGYQTSRESHQEEPSSLPVRSRPADQPAAEGSSSPRSSVSPNREHGYMKSTISSKQHEASTIAGHIDSETLHSEEYRTPTQPPLEEAPRSRSPSPTKAATRLTHDVTEFIQSEREKEILDRVQTSLRKLSPNRDHKSPSRENTPAKSTLSLQDIDVVTTADVQIDKNTTQTHTRTDSGKLNGEKPRSKSANILSSRTVSPTKKAASAPSKTPTSPTKARSVSPRKPLERPQSPHVPKTSGIKPRESTPSFIRKPTKVDVSFSRVDKVQSDAKKSTTTKQNSFSKTTSTFKSVASKVLSRAEAAPKRAPPPLRDNKENVSLRREEAKVARTSSDHAIRAAKPTPQRVRSKPEIQVTGTGTGTAAVTRGGLAPKPKSATALNTPTCDLGDVIVIVDVEQAKSSRESSPERRATCPTPVGPLEGPLEGAPRLPDAVSEPDDDWGQGQGRGIHEAECIVDVSDEGDAPARDECLLSVTAKVSRFTDKIAAAARPGEGAAAFGDAERREHSDFADDRLESDECLLSVSQKVSKFAKGPGQVREPSPARRIADEFDTGTVYQDDYTRMSVNDKAHLFVETARGTAAAAKPSPAPAPAFDADADADASLRSDDCLLSVSDKVNKFVRTAERFLESGETRTRRGPSDADALLKERYKDFLKQLQEDEAATAVAGGKGAEVPSFARETASWQGEAGAGATAPAPARPAERAPAAPALRSGDAVKKAKAVFENIAASESVASASASAKHTKATKLLDIGVMKKSPKTDSTTALHPSDEDSPDATDSEADAHRPNPPRHTTTSTTTTSTSHSRSVLSRYPAAAQTEHAPPRDNPRQASDVAAKTQRTAAAAAAGQPREQTAERAAEAPVSTRRGSGKFGVELRRTSLEAPLQGLERTKGAKGEGRRGSADRPQPQVEDIYDLQLLEQMLEKVVGYEQRRRIRSQIRVARKRLEGVPSAPRSPERRPPTKSPERGGQRRAAAPPPLVNGHAKGGAGPRPRSPEKRPLRQPSPEKRPLRQPSPEKRPLRQPSPEKRPLRQPSPEKRPLRQPSPEKRPRPRSPAKGAPRPPAKRISEYATAYMKKVGLDGAAEPPSASPDRAGRAHQASREQTTERTTTLDSDTGTGTTRVDTFEQRTVETSTSRTSNVSSSTVERRSSKESVRSSAAPAAAAGARSPSPGDRLYRRSPSPDFKRRATSAASAPAAGQPAWLASRNVHKVTSSTTTTSSSGGARSAGGVVEAVTSGYGPGPLDADGRPLFGIRALRTHDRTKQRDSSAASASEQEPSGGGGGQPDLERLLREPTARPARLHGLAAIANNYSGDARKKERDPPAPAAVTPAAPSPARADRGERKPVRQKSVQLLTEKYIKSTSDTGKSDRPGGATYPKAGLILRSGGLRDSPQGDPGAGAGADVHMARATITTTSTSTSTSTSSGARHERSFLDSTTKVTGVQDILSRMKNADIVIECGDTAEDSEARALLNKFLGATVLMAGMQSYVTETNANANAKPSRKLEGPVRGGGGSSSNRSSAPAPLSPADLARCWDERRLRQLLDECTEYEQRRLIRERLRDLMAERDACAAVAAGAEEEAQVEEVEVDEAEAEEAKANGAQQSETERVQAEVTVSVRKGSAEKTTSATKTTTTTTKTSKVGSASQPAQPASPFAKFRQLEKQNSTTSQNSASAPTPPSPGSPSVVNGNRGGPLFKFTDPALQLSALTIKERLLQWCRDKTRDYENVKLENFSTSWADGLAFCALVHHFVPDAFDYSRLAEATAAAAAAANNNAGQASAQQRRRNFTIAFKVADEKAGIYPLLDVEDMVAMRKPDWKCVFTYVQAIHRRFKDQP